MLQCFSLTEACCSVSQARGSPCTLQDRVTDCPALLTSGSDEVRDWPRAAERTQSLDDSRHLKLIVFSSAGSTLDLPEMRARRKRLCTSVMMKPWDWNSKGSYEGYRYICSAGRMGGDCGFAFPPVWGFGDTVLKDQIRSVLNYETERIVNSNNIDILYLSSLSYVRKRRKVCINCSWCAADGGVKNMFDVSINLYISPGFRVIQFTSVRAADMFVSL